MATVTYSTTAECAKSANIKNVGANSRPRETTFDEWREEVYAFMYEITQGIADSNNRLKSFEKAKVVQVCLAYLEGKPYSTMLTKEEKERLVIIVSQINGTDDVGGFYAFTPGRNAQYTP